MFGFTKRTKKFSILDMWPTSFYEGEDGAAGAAVAEAPVTDGGVIGTPEGVPKEFMETYAASDPDYEELVKQEAAIKKETKTPKPSDEEVIPEDEAGDSDKAEPKDAPAEEIDSGKAEIEAEEFADDVIEGLKGAHLKALPEEAKLALADYYTKSTEVSKENAALKERLAQLDADPIVREREEMLKQGKQQYDVRGITAEEKSSIISKIQAKIGVDAEDAEAVLSEVEDLIKTRSKDMAEDISKNNSLESSRRKQVDEITAKGRNIFLQLGKFNKELAFKETDASKFWARDVKGEWVPNEKHPEFKAYSEKILPVVKELGEAGVNYNTLIELSNRLGMEAVYTMVAKKLGLSVAINTEKRDAKMINAEVLKKLKPFMKGAASDELRAGTGKAAAPSPVIKHGYDITKLARDNDYRDRAIDSKPMDLTHHALIERLTIEGDAYLAKLKK